MQTFLSNPLFIKVVNLFVLLVLLGFWWDLDSVEFILTFSIHLQFLIITLILIYLYKKRFRDYMLALRDKKYRRLISIILVICIFSNAAMSALVVLDGQSLSKVSVARSYIPLDVLRHGSNYFLPVIFLHFYGTKYMKVVFLFIFTIFIFNGSKSGLLTIFSAFLPVYVLLNEGKVKIYRLIGLWSSLFIIVLFFRYGSQTSTVLLMSLKDRIDWYYLGVIDNSWETLLGYYDYFTYHLHYLSQILGLGRLYNVPIGTAISHGLDASAFAGGGANSNIVLSYLVFNFAIEGLYLLAFIWWFLVYFVLFLKKSIFAYSVVVNAPTYIFATDMYLFFTVGAAIVVTLSILFSIFIDICKIR